jgi:hypothetical protein
MKKVYFTPVGLFSAESKKEVSEFIVARYPGVKLKDISVSENKSDEPVIDIAQLLRREFNIKGVSEKIKLCFKEAPTRFFEVGEHVKYGNLDNMIVTEIHEHGFFYTISNGSQERFPTWVDIQKYRTPEEDNEIKVMRETFSFNLNFSNSTIDSLFSMIYSFGVEVDPPYQRGLEWSLEDKQLLINSILKDLDIGKFVFVRNSYKEEGAGYTVLDGKQRLNAIREFYEDRFTYNGLKYSELSFVDQYMFTGKGISYAYINGENLTEKDIVRYFLRLNQGGVVVSKEHLDKIANQYGLKD